MFTDLLWPWVLMLVIAFRSCIPTGLLSNVITGARSVPDSLIPRNLEPRFQIPSFGSKLSILASLHLSSCISHLTQNLIICDQVFPSAFKHLSLPWNFTFANHLQAFIQHLPPARTFLPPICLGLASLHHVPQTYRFFKFGIL